MTLRTQQAYDTLVLRKPKLVLALLLSVLVFFGYHTKDFKLDASADSLLLEDDVDLKVFRKIHERYTSNDLLIVTYTPDKDLFSDQALEPLGRLREELKKVTSVDTVFTILDAPLFNSSDADIQEMIKDMPSLEKPGIDRSIAPFTRNSSSARMAKPLRCCWGYTKMTSSTSCLNPETICGPKGAKPVSRPKRRKTWNASPPNMIRSMMRKTISAISTSPISEKL
jgi:hypothetical protein